VRRRVFETAWAQVPTLEDEITLVSPVGTKELLCARREREALRLRADEEATRSRPGLRERSHGRVE
jgi:hypothetical protein